jgi:hypothetical protein
MTASIATAAATATDSPDMVVLVPVDANGNPLLIGGRSEGVSRFVFEDLDKAVAWINEAPLSGTFVYGNGRFTRRAVKTIQLRHWTTNELLDEFVIDHTPRDLRDAPDVIVDDSDDTVTATDEAELVAA